MSSLKLPHVVRLCVVSEWEIPLLSSTFFTPTCDECRLNTLVVLRMVYLNIINDIVDGNCNRYCLVFDSMQSLCNESREYECLKSFNSIFYQFLIILIHYRLYIWIGYMNLLRFQLSFFLFFCAFLNSISIKNHIKWRVLINVHTSRVFIHLTNYLSVMSNNEYLVLPVFKSLKIVPSDIMKIPTSDLKAQTNLV